MTAAGDTTDVPPRVEDLERRLARRRASAQRRDAVAATIAKLRRQWDRVEETKLRLRRRGRRAIAAAPNPAAAAADEDRKVRVLSEKSAMIRRAIAAREAELRDLPRGEAGVPAALRAALFDAMASARAAGRRDEAAMFRARILELLDRRRAAWTAAVGVLRRAAADLRRAVAALCVGSQPAQGDREEGAEPCLSAVGVVEMGDAHRHATRAGMMVEEALRRVEDTAHDWPEARPLLELDTWREPPTEAIVSTLELEIELQLGPVTRDPSRWRATIDAAAAELDDLAAQLEELPPPIGDRGDDPSESVP